MADFKADLRDIRFVVNEQLDLEPLLRSERYRDFGEDDIAMILEEAYKFSREIMAPTNQSGDREGCTLEDGKVTVPSSCKQAYMRYKEAGWVGLSVNPEWGGQGAPHFLRIAVDDFFFGANIGLNLGVMLTPGAAHLVEHFGTEATKKTYLRKMYSGEWMGTMCLTEPQAGSDVGAATTRAKKQDDHYLIEGEKIFITFGEHDLSDNIIHCVLARTEAAPKGTKGLSLFVVPKYLVNDDGSLGEFNNVTCVNIEHKLGINASPTCTMNFGASGPCKGWLLGNELEGMRNMFVLMNEARIGVGLQGSALGNAAYQAALGYAKERLQGTDIASFKDPDAPRVPIVRHPDVRVMLLRQKAYAEGCRSMLLFAAYCMDREAVAQDEKERAHYQGLVDIMTPICKAYCSDMGFRVTEWALQTYGGYGYLQDYPAEQYMRDCKIASIYEGTNGIQALDLVGRKLRANNGADVMRLASMISKLAEEAKSHPTLGVYAESLTQAQQAWGKANVHFMKCAAKKDLQPMLLNATTYLSLCGDMLMGYFLLKQGLIASDKLDEVCKSNGVDAGDSAAVRTLSKSDSEAAFYHNKVATARFFAASELPQVEAKAKAIMSGDTSAMDAVFVPSDA